ncbi:MAG: CRISPR-associated protein Csx3 [bacterium]|nr:CRISPR-associated protein Csx3 [bacterium]
MATNKFVVAGPPHSGKSVFLAGLCENLPRDSRYLFRACPDGEGTWLQNHYDRPDVVALRRKGQFIKEMVDWYSRSLADCVMAPIILVDIGGRPSEENRRILSEGQVNYGIILAGDLERVPEWETFLESCGVTVIAVVRSDYTGEADSIQRHLPRLEGSVHFLERGDVTVSTRPVIQAVAELILGLVASPSEKKEEKMATIVISALAAEIGKVEVERTLPNGVVVRQIVWEGSDLPAIAGLLHNQSAEMADPVDIDGAAPAWLTAALAHECHPRSVRLNSPDGFIAVGCRRPKGEGAGCGWTRIEIGTAGDGRKLIKVEFQLDPSIPLAPAALGTITPPEVEMADVVVLSGRGPNWLTASIAMAYHGRAAAVACWQPGTGATIAWTHVQDVPLGHVFHI